MSSGGLMRRAALALVAAACADRSDAPPPVDEVLVTASDAAVAVDEDRSVPIVLLAAADPSDAGPIGFTIEEEPVLGVLEGAGGSLTYTPAADANGEDGFTFTARVGDAVSALARVTITVHPVDDAPTATALQVGTDEDTAVSDRLPAVDLEGDALAWVLVSAPAHGRAELDATTGDFTYTPDADYAGADGFLWSASDPSGLGTGPARVEVVVAAVNDPPVVAPATVLAAEDEVAEGVVGASDPDGDALALALVRDADHGAVALDTNTGAFTYTPDPDWYGPDSFEVVADDGVLSSAPGLVELVVASVNDPPVAPDVQILLDEDVPAAGAVAATDADGDALAFSVLDPPAHGAIALDGATGALTYTPDRDWSGQDDALVRVSDPFDAAPPARVVLVVAPVNDPPTAAGGLLLTDEDVPVAGSVHGADPDGDVLAWSLARPPLHGTVEVDAATGDLVYTPDRDWAGVDDFGVVADDGAALSAEALVTVDVLPVNDPPIVPVASLSIVGDVPGTVSVATTDPEGDTLLYWIQVPPAHGDALLDPLSGLLEYDPDAGWSGGDVAVIRVSDGELDVVAFVPITVDADGDADGAADAVDVCPDVADPLQRDENGNGVGDRCDCLHDPVTAPLDPEIWSDAQQASADTQYSFTPPYGLELRGDTAALRTFEAPAGCASWTWSFEVRTGDDVPETGDHLLLDASVDGGPWVPVDLVQGTGAAIPWEHREGDTVGLGLAGSLIEWRFTLVADSATDEFVIDEVRIGCDSDADGLPDCTEATIPGYDLGVADGDGDGWLDADEHAAGTDPFLADTDGDGVDDPADGCPLESDPAVWPGASATCPAASCLELVGAGADGPYWLSPAGGPAVHTWCDLTTDGGGWTLGFLRNSRSTGSNAGFGGPGGPTTDLGGAPAAASASNVPSLSWHDLESWDWTELRVAAYSSGASTYTSRTVPRSELRIRFGQDGYLLYGGASGYYWCGGVANYTDRGVGATNNPPGAPADCRGHASLGTGWDFSEGTGGNLGLTMCGPDASNWMHRSWAGSTVTYGTVGAAQAIWVR